LQGFSWFSRRLSFCPSFIGNPNIDKFFDFHRKINPYDQFVSSSFIEKTKALPQQKAMGIQGFGVFLRKKAPEIFRRVERLSYFRGATVAIDMEHKVHQMFYRNGGNTEAVMRDVESFLKRLGDNSIDAYFVFDGDTKGLKNTAHEKRKKEQERRMERHEDLETKIKALEDLVEEKGYNPELMMVDKDLVVRPRKAAKRSRLRVEAEDEAALAAIEEVSLDFQLVQAKTKHAASSRQIMKPRRDLFASVYEYLDRSSPRGRVVTAPDDAEREVALMARSEKVHFAVSADYDTLAFGSPNLVIDFMNPVKMSILRLDDVLEALGIRMGQFIDFAILCGCDFSGKVPGIGPHRALSIIKDYETIEDAYDAKLKCRFKTREEEEAFVPEFARARFSHASVDRKIIRRQREKSMEDDSNE
jgi:5'-3' exonuclease